MQITGEKTETLAGFNGRTGQDYAVYLLGSERRDRGGNGKIGLARSGRADAESYRIICYCVAIGFLAEGFCLDRLALCRYAHNVACKLVYLRFPALGNELEDISHTLRVDILAARGKRKQTVYRFLGEHDALLLAADVYLILAVKDFNAKLGFNYAQVSVERAEHAYYMLHSFDFYRSFNHSLPPWQYSLCTERAA